MVSVLKTPAIDHFVVGFNDPAPVPGGFATMFTSQSKLVAENSICQERANDFLLMKVVRDDVR